MDIVTIIGKHEPYEETEAIDREMPVVYKMGRPKGVKNSKNYRWKVEMYDKEKCIWKVGKFITIADINETLGLKLNGDYVKRIMTKYKTDMSMRNGEHSFLAKYGHIKIEKICEPVIQSA